MLELKFVKFIPDLPKSNVLYISMEYKTALHMCVCGCNNKVVTPISPIQWAFKYNGETISLYPSIGNWNFDCKSHYWIKNNKIEWSDQWSENKILELQKNEKKEINNFYSEKGSDKKDSFYKKFLKFLNL
jgi:hypothetical protein